LPSATLVITLYSAVRAEKASAS